MKGVDGPMRKTILYIALLFTLALFGCADNKQEIVAYVGDVPITMAEFEFYLTNVKEQLQGTELSDDEDWQNKEIDGRKAIEVAKDRALDNAIVNIAYIKIYEGLGKNLSADDKSKIEKLKEDIVGEYSDVGYDEFLKENNITDEFVDMLCKSTYCAEVLYNEVAQEKGLADEELDAYFEKYIDEKIKEFGIVASETDIVK